MACGVVMIVSVVWAAVALNAGQSIFLPEAIALVAFAISWLTKGRAHEPVVAVFRRVSGLVVK